MALEDVSSSTLCSHVGTPATGAGHAAHCFAHADSRCLMMNGNDTREEMSSYWGSMEWPEFGAISE